MRFNMTNFICQLCHGTYSLIDGENQFKVVWRYTSPWTGMGLTSLLVIVTEVVWRTPRHEPESKSRVCWWWLLESWLTTREQKILVDGEKSRSVKVKSGVPQGTVLGPLMFLLYINDIGENIGSSVRLFADDSLIYMAVSSRNVS